MTDLTMATEGNENNNSNNDSGLGYIINTNLVEQNGNCENKYYVTDQEDIACPFMKLFTCMGKKVKTPHEALELHIDPFRQTQWKLLNTRNEQGTIPNHPYIQQSRDEGGYSSPNNEASADTLLQIGQTNSENVNTVKRPAQVSSPCNFNDVSEYSLTNPDQYDFTHPHRGYAVVIVNQYFARLNPRNGADVDLFKTRELLKKLGYLNKNIERHNLNKESTLTILHDARNADHSKLDSFSLIISSHGNEMEHPRNKKREHVIYCSDDHYIFTSDIVEMFSDDNCPSLKGKPKLFFIQACRGTNTDDGAQIGVHVDDRIDIQEQSFNSRFPYDGTRLEQETQKSLMNPKFESSHFDRFQREDDIDVTSFEEIWGSKPLMSCNNDCLVMYASPFGYCAWRSNDDGSWMLHYLWQEVMSYDYLKPCSFLKVLTAVNRKMAARETNVPENPMKSYKKAIPVITHQLDKDIVFRQKH